MRLPKWPNYLLIGTLGLLPLFSLQSAAQWSGSNEQRQMHSIFNLIRTVDLVKSERSYQLDLQRINEFKEQLPLPQSLPHHQTSQHILRM